MPPQAAAQQDDWGDSPAQAKPDQRFEWGDEGEKAQAAPPAGTTTATEQPGAMRRFWNGVKAGTSAEPMPPVDPNRDYLHNPDFANNPLLPGAGVYRDIKSGNYAGATGRVLGPAAELGLMVLGGRGRVEAPPERVPLWKQAGIEAGPPPSAVDATPSEPYRPVRPPRVTAVPAQPPVEAPFRRPNPPAPYSTEEQAWRRYPAVDSAQDLAETKAIQSSVKEQAEGEQRNMLKRGTEEGYARNTRPRTSKGELEKQFQSGKAGAKASGSEYQGVDLNSEKELTELLKRSLELATKVKARK